MEAQHNDMLFLTQVLEIGRVAEAEPRFTGEALLLSALMWFRYRDLQKLWHS